MARNTTDKPAAAAPPPAPHDPLFDSAPETPAAPAPSKALVPQTETAPGTFTDANSTIAKRGAYGDELVASRESTAVAAQVQAVIAARTMHALKNPRSFDEARIAILRDCKRPAFAKAAIFRKPIGNTHIEGLSIRFAESALRHWTNAGSESIMLYDGAEKRIVRIMVGDFQTNTWHSRDITIMKTVERKSVKPGQNVVSQRVGSQGQIVYEVEATDDELQVKEGAARSKVLRNEGLRLIPADILEEALAACRKTRNDEDAKDPDAARKAVADAFAEIGVMPGDIESYLGCSLGQATTHQVGELREWFVAVRDGDATWQEILAARVGDIQGNGDEEKPSSAVASLKERAMQKAAERKAAKP